MSVKFLYKAVLLSFLFVACQTGQESGESAVLDQVSVETPVDDLQFTPDEDLQNFYDNGLSEQLVVVEAVVIKNLADDNEGSRHQKFLIELGSGQTLLVSHNIDLAKRIDNLREGDDVTISGQYEWNDRGGVVHWTHHDPDGIHPGGWIIHNNVVYE